MKIDVKNILLVTKNDDLIEALKIILGGQYSLFLLKTLEFTPKSSFSYNCILFDFINKTESKFEDFQRIKLKAKVPMIAIFDKEDIWSRKEAMAIGIYDYLEVPLEPDRVLMAVNRAINYEKLSRFGEK